MTTQTRAEAVLLSLTLIWGSTFVFMKLGLRDMSPMLMTGVRFFVASLVFLLLFRRKLFPLPQGALHKGVYLGLFLVLGFLAQNVGLEYTTASKSAFITSLMVVFVPVLQFVIEKKAPTIGNLVGIGVVVAGLWLLTSPEGAQFNVGDLLTLLCALLFAVYIVYLDVASKAMSAAQLTFLQSETCAAVALLASALVEDTFFKPTFSVILSLGYLTLFATVLTTFAQTRFQKETTPTRAAVIFSIEPVWASLLAFIVLDERLGAWGILGAALIIAGVLISELSDRIPLMNRAVVGERA
ncbi:MAG TPA: DMT family transporter [Bacteroidota bacterium]|nr:DMT family transporter [Bacteroidota bacterium]